MPVDPDRAVWLINQLRHVRGRWAGQPFALRPWQELWLRDLLRVDRRTRRRVIREALLGMPRKNGKTQLVAALGIVLLILDDEPGGEVIAGAAKRDQAALILDTAKRMVLSSSPGGVRLDGPLKVQRHAIYYPESDSVFRVVSADAPKEHGLNPHAVLIDELHAQPNRDLYDALTTAQGVRENPLAISITTAGALPKGLCHELYRYGREIDQGLRNDPAFLFRWWEPSPDLDWRDPAAWRQSNPALGDFLELPYLERQAQTKPEYVFRRLHLNQWTTAIERWLPLEAWDRCAGEPQIPDGARVVIAGDAALSRDTFAVAVVRIDDETPAVAHVRAKSFRPEGGRRYIDQLDVETHILGLAARYDVEAFVYDPAYMQLIGQRLEDVGVPCEPFPQRGERIMRAAELLQQLVLEGRLRHGGDVDLTAQLASVGIRRHDRGVQISKGRSGGPVDAVVAVAMGLERAVAANTSGDFALIVD